MAINHTISNHPTVLLVLDAKVGRWGGDETGKKDSESFRFSKKEGKGKGEASPMMQVVSYVVLGFANRHFALLPWGEHTPPTWLPTYLRGELLVCEAYCADERVLVG